ncbi:MAG: hypothetical protein JKY67_15960 [Pseudomonadales bacterium]|nr:hypothetical protein [Pseudomonadales bacterium]
MEEQTNQELKELNDQYHRGFFDRPSYQNKRSALIDQFVMSKSGNDTVQMAANKPDAFSWGTDNDILDVAEMLSISKNPLAAPSGNGNGTSKSKKRNRPLRKRELLLIISGAMMAMAGYLFYVVTSQ